LATGDSHRTIAFSSQVGRSTVSNIVKEVCQELWNVLQPLYLPIPSEEMWMQAVTVFRELWEFLNCLGSTDGKQVKLKCPASTGSNYFCYKNYCSTVLLAIVDPYYKFIIVDIGSYGRHSDSGIFKNSAFYREYIDGKTILPSKPLPSTNIPVPRVLIGYEGFAHVLTGDKGFALQTYLMCPFLTAVIANDARKKKFNKQLSRAWHVVKIAFRKLAQKWRVFFLGL